MFAKFSLYNTHLDFAHHLWHQLLHKEDVVIDATCGKGHDTLFLAQRSDTVYAIDLQPAAIEATKKLLTEQGFLKVRLIEGSHVVFPAEIAPQSVKLIVYNLGYLPKGDKALTTKAHTTLSSMHEGLKLLKPGGAMSITCYSGHPEGLIEEQAVLQFIQELNPLKYSCSHHRWMNRRHSPSLIVIQAKV